MELKNYQKKVMQDIESFVSAYDNSLNVEEAWKNYWKDKGISIGNGIPKYSNDIKDIPHVCIKVPTGGGKTFMACSALKYLFSNNIKFGTKSVVWLVPSDSILTQTVDALSDPNHPYRQRLQADFSGSVNIFEKEALLNGQNFSPTTIQDSLNIFVMSFSSLRIDSKNKEIRKVYQENGNLMPFSNITEFGSAAPLDNTPSSSLIQVIRNLTPVIIVDESHNATSKLSIEMLNNLNPSFILDLTATPRKCSNIISYVDAISLKKENMVKLPIMVYNTESVSSVLSDSILLRNKLEESAKQSSNDKYYIRPIVLFQAQPQTNDESESFDKIKEKLMLLGINEDEIAIKTSKIDDLKGINLQSPDCNIRYIITVNALKEGWDCPFAYILTSLANRSSPVDVEQIVGRILRQPYARMHDNKALNMSYVLTSSNNFYDTLDNIVKSLENSGFSKRDCLADEEEPITPKTENKLTKEESLDIFSQIDKSNTVDNEENINTNCSASQSGIDDFEKVDFNDIKKTIEESKNEGILETAIKKAEEYEKNISDSSNNISDLGADLNSMIKKSSIKAEFLNEINELKLPQFMLHIESQNLFGGNTLLDSNHLLDGISLKKADSKIDFDTTDPALFEINVNENINDTPKYNKVSKDTMNNFLSYIASLPSAEKKNKFIEMICSQLDALTDIHTKDELKDYISRCLNSVTDAQLNNLDSLSFMYAKKIKEKIRQIEEQYKIDQFDDWLNKDKIFCENVYSFSKEIPAPDKTANIAKSLYSEEKDDFNKLEKSVIVDVASLKNVEWWHRVLDRNDFKINGYINHYPDFIVKTTSGKIILVETKGEHLKNQDSINKLKLGKTWAQYAGPEFKYFMVFENDPLDGALSKDKFIETLESL